MLLCKKVPWHLLISVCVLNHPTWWTVMHRWFGLSALNLRVSGRRLMALYRMSFLWNTCRKHTLTMLGGTNTTTLIFMIIATNYIILFLTLNWSWSLSLPLIIKRILHICVIWSWFPYSQFSILRCNISRIPCIWCLCCTVDTLCSGLFEIWRFSIQRIYSGFKVIEAGIVFTKTSDSFRKFYGRHTDLVHTFATSVSHMLKGFVHQLWPFFRYVQVDRDGCHMWGWKYSLLPEHLISLPFGEFMISPIHYTYIICIIFGIC